MAMCKLVLIVVAGVRACRSPPLALALSVLILYWLYMYEPPDATHGDAVGRYVRANACLYLLLPTRPAMHSNS